MYIDVKNVDIYIYICVTIYIYICVCVYVCLCVHMGVCAYVCVCIYIYIYRCMSMSGLSCALASMQHPSKESMAFDPLGRLCSIR